jgi:LPS sulfotransferase NodH
MTAGTTANGVFGAKVMWGYMEDVLAKLAALTGGEGLQGHTLLCRWFPNLHYVWITRRDRVAQAVSWSRAIQSRRWYAGDRRHGEDVPVEFSFHHIDHLVKEIDAHELAWSEFFDRSGVAPLHVIYEALEQNMKTTVVTVLRFLGIDPAGVRIEPRTTRLRDTLNEEWGKEYARLAADQ